MSEATTAPIKDRILDWTRREKLFIEEVADDRARFRIRVRPPGRAGAASGGSDVIQIAQPSDGDDRIVVSTGIAFDETLAGPMRALADRDELLLALEQSLDGLIESYVVDCADGFLRSFLVYDEIFADGLTKDRFIRSLRGVHRGLLIGLWAIRPLVQALGGDIDRRIGLAGEEPRPAAAAASAVRGSVADTQKGQTAACPSCGAQTVPGAKFCSACGAPLASAPPPKAATCAACGETLRPGARFCAACGAAAAPRPGA